MVNRSTNLAPALLLFAMMSISSTYAQRPAAKTILFICEHGSAKSVVAAAHFNRMAKEAGIPIMAITRGTNPDEKIPDKINSLLKGDGFPEYNGTPVRLSTKDLQAADFTVAFSTLPSEFKSPKNFETWNIPSFEAGYPVARDSIILNIERLIQRIK